MSLADKVRYSLEAITNIKAAVKRKNSAATENTPLKNYSGLIDAITTVKNQNKTQSITANGTVTIKPDSGYTGLGQVTVTTNVNTVKNQAKTQSVTANGSVTVKPDSRLHRPISGNRQY